MDVRRVGKRVLTRLALLLTSLYLTSRATSPYASCAYLLTATAATLSLSRLVSTLRRGGIPDPTLEHLHSLVLSSTKLLLIPLLGSAYLGPPWALVLPALCLLLAPPIFLWASPRLSQALPSLLTLLALSLLLGAASQRPGGGWVVSGCAVYAAAAVVVGTRGVFCQSNTPFSDIFHALIAASLYLVGRGISHSAAGIIG